MTTGEGKGGIGQVGCEAGMNSAKRLQVGRGEVNRVTVRDECSLAIAVSRRLHRPLEPALELDRLEPGPEQASGLALEDAFEEPLQGGHWGAHGPSQSSRRPVWARSGPGGAAAGGRLAGESHGAAERSGRPTGMDEIGGPSSRMPGTCGRGHWSAVRYTLAPFGMPFGSGLFIAYPGA